MIGGMLSGGHDECAGDLIFEDDNQLVGMKFYGMASETAMEKHGNLIKNEYRGSEGKTVTVHMRGAVKLLQWWIYLVVFVQLVHM